MKAKLIGKSPSEKSKSGLSYRYVVEGTKEELELFVKTENFLKYPAYDEPTGLPMIFRNSPLLAKTPVVGISRNNRYYCDETDVLDQMAITEKMAKTSTIFAKTFAEKAVSSIGAIAGFMDKIDISEPEEAKEESKK